MTCVFISGSRSISRLNDTIRQRLSNLTRQNFDLVIGDANGADKAVQQWLHAHGYTQVTVYCAAQKRFVRVASQADLLALSGKEQAERLLGQSALAL